MKWILSVLLVLSSLAVGQTCGVDGKPICEFAPATRISASGCQDPEFLDVGRNECWQCPTGYGRTLSAVTANDACSKPVAAVPYTATKNGVSGCQGGEFLDVGLNQCWSCPAGYTRTLSAVSASDACSKTVAVQQMSANYFGAVPGCAAGQFTDLTVAGCWSCPDGYVRTINAVTASNACQTGGILGPVSAATNHGNPGCPSGQFTDLTLGGCWSCPSGTNRTVYAVNSASACEQPAYNVVSAASYKRPNPCPAGQFQDPIDGGTCWSCPSGTVRTIFPVNGSNACEVAATSVNSAASFKHAFPCPAGQIYDVLSGGCWTCPANHNRSIWPITTDVACTIDAGMACGAGLIDIGGTCRKSGACGGDNQRPCTVIERIPSCDPGYYEEFSIEKCLPIKAGESPFLKGLGSLVTTIFDPSAICKDVAGLFPIIQKGNLELDGTLACAAGFTTGFACAIPSLAPDLMKAGEATTAIGAAYDLPPCSVPYNEEFQPATKQGVSTLISCPEGQFFDMIDNGSCWTCPVGWARTLYGVNTKKACSRGEGVPELFRGLCAVGQVVTSKNVGDPMGCLSALFKGGLPLEQGNSASLDATRKMCTLAGEFAFESVAKSIIPLGVVEDPVVRRGRILAAFQGIQEGLDSVEFMARILAEPACAGFLTKPATSVSAPDRARSGVTILPGGGLRIDLPDEAGAYGILRRLDGTRVLQVRSPGISLAPGFLRSGVYLLTIKGSAGEDRTTIPVTVP